MYRLYKREDRSPASHTFSNFPIVEFILRWNGSYWFCTQGFASSHCSIFQRDKHAAGLLPLVFALLVFSTLEHSLLLHWVLTFQLDASLKVHTIFSWSLSFWLLAHFWLFSVFALHINRWVLIPPPCGLFQVWRSQIHHESLAVLPRMTYRGHHVWLPRSNCVRTSWKSQTLHQSNHIWYFVPPTSKT